MTNIGQVFDYNSIKTHFEAQVTKLLDCNDSPLRVSVAQDGTIVHNQGVGYRFYRHANNSTTMWKLVNSFIIARDIYNLSQKLAEDNVFCNECLGHVNSGNAAAEVRLQLHDQCFTLWSGDPELDLQYEADIQGLWATAIIQHSLTWNESYSVAVDLIACVMIGCC